MNKESIVETHVKHTYYKKDLEDFKKRVKLNRVAIYVRLSEEDKNKLHPEDDSKSIENQKSMLKEYAIQKGWDIVEVYSDDDFSGADSERPAFKRMLLACENDEIDIVLCKTQSRFSRDMEVVEKYLHKKFIEWNVRFVSVVDNADTSIKSNKKSRQINGLINEWYLEDLSENIKTVLKHKKEKGEYTGSFACYGYLISPNDKHKLIVDPDSKDIVKLIFQMYMDGKGYSKIAEYLTRNNVPTPYKLKKLQGSNFVCKQGTTESSIWNKDSVRKILMNETYIGNLVQGKVENISYKSKKRRSIDKSEWIVTQNTHEPIIDMDTWNAVQRRFNSRGVRTSYNTGEIHLFSKKVYCSECGKAMARNNGYSKNHTFTYLRCKRKASNPLACTNGGSFRYDYLENIVLDELNKLIATYKDNSLKDTLEHELNLENEREIRLKELDSEKNKLNTTLLKKKSTLKSLYEDKEDGIITTEEFIELKQDWTEDIKNLNAKLVLIDESIQSLQKEQGKKEDINDILNKYDKIDKLDRVIIDSFIDSIYISSVDEETKKRTINIEWNI